MSSKSSIEFKHVYSLTSEWMTKFSTELGCTIVNDTIMHFPKHLAEGSSYFLNIHPDMSVFVFDMIHKQSVNFSRMPVEEAYWILYYDLSDDNNQHVIKNIKHSVGENSKLSFAIMDSRTQSAYISKKGVREFSLRILVRKSFITQLLHTKQLSNNISQMLDNELFFYGLIDSKSKSILFDLKKKKIDSPFYNLLINSVAYNLLGFFLEKQSQFNMDDENSIFERDRDAILKSHEFLIADLTVPFPGIETLVQIANMSITKYRRLYKSIYKTTPVAFFRTEKLLYAKQLMETGNFRSISEIAFSLGYNNVNHFMIIYKKQFGSCPFDEI
ncbi:AraC family transcriptional regulator [Flavobacterium sp. NKUCC04_CG]|uniref:helix-turn-helix domain-containing protein n=1 Tax=Flavobacterium sp. NKUCC04_CG TaxID=2842121 RepID=UPI001C5AB453|nr:AraC family transcriptional regulator [Flavobacterium sp. NKUCC04_CG]MBW3519205.1 AraC family transcriptional regulator [Flavobacterium sp. NKUCC04_CG]